MSRWPLCLWLVCGCTQPLVTYTFDAGSGAYIRHERYQR